MEDGGNREKTTNALSKTPRHVHGVIDITFISEVASNAACLSTFFLFFLVFFFNARPPDSHFPCYDIFLFLMENKSGGGDTRCNGRLSRLSNSATNQRSYWNRINLKEARSDRDPYLSTIYSTVGRKKDSGTNHPWISEFSLGQIDVRVSFFFPFHVRNDKNHSIHVEVCQEKTNERHHRASIFHSELLMALRLNVPENLRYEQLAHYFTSMWILACTEFLRAIRVASVECALECSRRCGKHGFFASL